MSKMYEKTTTWNPHKGCLFDCIYCEPSFKRQAKRQKHKCLKCYNYEPHFHPERLNRIPKDDYVFACANGDFSFTTVSQRTQILLTMARKPNQTFLLQTKAPNCLIGYEIPDNVIVGTTIETNGDTKHISKAPSTEQRYRTLKRLNCRKYVTIEPIMDFDLNVLGKWIKDLEPEIV